MRVESMRKGILLERIHFQLFEGERVHCVFDNLQEKNAFLQIMSGMLPADYEKVYYDEKRIPEDQIQSLFRTKIAVITKESNLINSVSITENIFLICPVVARNWLDHRKFKRDAAYLFEKFDVHINIHMPVRKLTVFEKVQIELVKAYLHGQQIVILTELYNLFSNQERKKLMELLKKMQNTGMCCVILEPLEDIEFADLDKVIIIKHGKTCLIKEKEECDYTMLHKALYYDELKKRSLENIMMSHGVTSNKGVRIERLCSEYLKDINLEIHKGEIAKVLCVDENSYHEFVRLIQGQSKVCEGTVVYNEKAGQPLKKSLRGLKNGIGIAVGNPATATLFKELTVMDNLQMLLSKKVNHVWLAPKFKKSIRLILQDVIPNELFQKRVKDLHPSDVQRVLYSRWFLFSPELLICIQPFAEGNIEARETARKMLYMLKERGIPILIITSNSAEFNYCIGKEIYIRDGKCISKEKAYRFLLAENG